MQGRESSNEYSDLQAYFPMLERIDALVDDLKSWREAVLYKHGPQHDFDLVEHDVIAELSYAKHDDYPATMSRRQDIFSDDDSEGNETSDDSE